MGILREGVSYGIVGVLQLGVDWGCFVLLSALGIGVVPANITGRIIGALVGFWLNGKATFSLALDGGLSLRHLLRFSLSWGVMTVASTIVIGYMDHAKGLHFTWLVKPVADAVLALLGFTVSKYWIYR